MPSESPRSWLLHGPAGNVYKIRDLLISRRFACLLQERARLVIDEVRREQLDAGSRREDSASERYVAGALSLILPLVSSEISVRFATC